MSGWNEKNFLERLMPYLRHRSLQGENSCPSSEVLTAFCDGALDMTCEAVQPHVARCPQCSEIRERLAGFESANVTVSDAEWGGAEKRLGNWAYAFLAPELARSARPRPVAAAWRDLVRWTWSLPVRHGVAVSATLALVIGIPVYLFFAQRPPIPPTVASVAKPQTGARSDRSNVVPALPQSRLPAATGALQRSKNSKSNLPKAIPPAAIAQSQVPVGLASLKASRMMPLKGEPAALADELEIEAGTGVLVHVDSLVTQADGTLVFHAVLAQPVVQHGRTILPAGSGIAGAGPTSLHGGVTLRIDRVELSNTSYVLKDLEISPNARSSTEVRLTQGQTQEMRFIASSTYHVRTQAR
jgi:hypothetical protein